MEYSRKAALLALCSSLLARGAFAQDSGACGSDITQSVGTVQIKFLTFCQERLQNGSPTNPIVASSYENCSTACIDQGTSCGGFAYDRDSYYDSRNCYLLQPEVHPWDRSTENDNQYFDSGIVDTNSIPETVVDCNTLGQNGVYNNMNLHCGGGITDQVSHSGNQINAVFAKSLGDCINQCNTWSNEHDNPCEAVTWDRNMTYGYLNCIMKTTGYMEPIVNSQFDSATLVGTSGQVVGGGSSSSSSSTASATQTSAPGSASHSATASATSPARTSSAAASSAPSKSTVSSGALAGIVVALVVVILALVGTILFLLFKLRRLDRKLQAVNRGLTVRDLVYTRPDESKTASVTEVQHTGHGDDEIEMAASPPPTYGFDQRQ